MDCDNQKSQNAGYTFPDYPLYPYPVTATGGASCKQTEPAIQGKANCAQAPRPGYNEMAEQQMQGFAIEFSESVKTKLIRAREIGQREGREDRQDEITRLVEHKAALMRDLARAKQSPPVWVAVDARVAPLQAKLTSLECHSSTLERTVGTQAATIEELLAKNSRLQARIKLAVALITK